MFTVTEDHRFTWPVKVQLPSADKPGEFEVQTFTGHFRLLPKERANELAGAMTDAATRGAAAIGEQEMVQIREVLLGWGDDVVDADKTPVPFSTEALDVACRIEPVRTAIAVAYAEAAAGGARRGN